MNTQSKKSLLSPSSTTSITSLTWNVENLKKNKFTLKHFVDELVPDFIFLNEVQTFQFESKTATDIFQTTYSYFLNSDDMHDMELPFIKNRSHGGTMVLWKHTLDQYVTPIPPVSQSFLPIVFHPPASPPSLHIALYLPTSGKESEFIDELSKLRHFLEDFLEYNSDHAVYIRGDSNVNTNNKTRLNIFNDFISCFCLTSIPIGHKTYHHFLGNGLFDSSIDVILCSTHFGLEKVEDVFCKHNHPIIDSHHDPILSSFLLPSSPVKEFPTRTQAPLVPNTRMKIIWNEDSIENYKNLIGNNLTELRKRWFLPSSKSCTSLLLQATSDLLLSASVSTNKSVSLSSSPKPKPHKIPNPIRKSMNRIKRKYNVVKCFSPNDPRFAQADFALKTAKREHRSLIRSFNQKQNAQEDQRMISLLSSGTSSSIFKKIRSLKSSSVSKIPFIDVANDKYEGDAVKDGFYTSIKALKSKNKYHGLVAPNNTYVADYQHILDLML